MQPLVLGALCDAVVEALRNYGDVHLDQSPRMADFAKWVVAAEPALPWEQGRFMAEYEKNRFEQIDMAIEYDLISLSIMEMMKRVGQYKNTPTHLLNTLRKYIPDGISKKGWPQGPNIFSNRLLQIQTTLRAKGIEVKKGKSGNRYIHLWKREAGQSDAGHPAHQPHPQKAKQAAKAGTTQNTMTTNGGGKEYDI
jgi:hypothetical protein